MKNGLPVKAAACAKARSNRTPSRLSSLAKGQGSMQGWCVVRGGVRKVGRDLITEGQVCPAQESGPYPEAVGKWQGDKSAVWRKN